MSKKLLMCFAMLFMCINAALAQTKISGTVVAAEDNEPVIGAQVKHPNTERGCCDGSYPHRPPSLYGCYRQG